MKHESIETNAALLIILALVVIIGGLVEIVPLHYIELSHYTDWTVGHVGSGSLGWVTMVTFYLIIMLRNTTLYSVKLVYVHFFLATIGILLYITALWVSGIGQGLMLRAYDQYGNLKYTFIETVLFMHGPLVARAIAGMFFVTGLLIMIYNVYKTITQAQSVESYSTAQEA